MSIRIAYIISQYPEFHETFIAREVEALRSKGMPPRIFSLKTPSGAERELYPDHNDLVEYSSYFASTDVFLANLVEAVRHPVRYLKAFRWILCCHCCKPLEMIKALAAFPKTVFFARRMRGKYDLLHAHWATIPAAMAAVVNILTGIRFSITAHAWDIYLSPPAVLRDKISRACGVVTCTDYNAEYLRTVCEPGDRFKIHRNYHGIDFADIPEPEASRDTTSPFRVIAVGRLVEQKGFIYLIRAVAQLVRQKLPVQLTIVGEGPLHDLLRNEVRSLTDGDAIVFAGRLPHGDTIRLIRSSHLMVAPSVISGNGDRDGIPNVILEGMACGVPVVASKVSGIPEIVKDGVTGLTVPPGDVSAIAAAIAGILQKPDLGVEYGREGKRFVERHFSIMDNANELIALLEQFASAPAGSSG